MGVAAPAVLIPSNLSKQSSANTFSTSLANSSSLLKLLPHDTLPNTRNYRYSMSQDYHHQQRHQSNVFSFSNSLGSSQQGHHHQQQPQLVQQIRREKFRGYEHPTTSLVGIEGADEGEGEQPSAGLHQVFESAGMLSEMFNFQGSHPPPGSASELLGHPSLPPSYRTQPRQQMVGEWYTNSNHRQQAVGLVASGLMGPLTNLNEVSTKTDHIHGINADSATAMQLFLMNPHQPRSPSPAPNANSSSTLHMLLPNPSVNSLQFNAAAGGVPFGGPQSTWIHDAAGNEAGGSSTNTNTNNSTVESQGLSLSLSSHLQAGKADEFRLGGDGAFLYAAAAAAASPTPRGDSQHLFYKGFGLTQPSQHPALQFQGSLMNQSQSHQLHHQQQGLHVGFGGISGTNSASASPLGMTNAMRNSRYLKPAQELLEEFCGVGRGLMKRNKLTSRNSAKRSSSSNNNCNLPAGGNNGGNGSSSGKDLPPLSAAERIEHQRRKVKLLSMLDEVDRRYNHYGEQMQTVVNSFDLVMGFGSAVPYTALAQKAMSRHFRCLKDAITAQLKHSCELLGEKDAAGNSGITKGETPRLKMLEQSLRQQREFHQMGMMEHEAWRPQRGLPERSVNILRAWLFEHFLHPYPSDADKHLLARQTGLSRNQVSNWFINARVRLWKPMVEDMYQQESKDEDSASEERNLSLTPPPPSTTAGTQSPPQPPPSAISSINDNVESDPSVHAMQHRQRFAAENQGTGIQPMAPLHDLSDPTCQRSGILMADYGGPPTIGNPPTGDLPIIRFGANALASGDVSLTLGLRHVGNVPEKGSSSSAFRARNYGGC